MILPGDTFPWREVAVSTFYLLPPRPLLGEHFANYLKTLFPSLDWASSTWTELGETVGATAAGRPDVFVVFREDLPDGEDLAQALANGFGAEAGDEVIEVRPGFRPGELRPRRWPLDGAV
jgi:hypothetical protein